MISKYSHDWPEAIKTDLLINNEPIICAPYHYFQKFPDYNIVKIKIPGRDAEDIIFNLYDEKTQEEVIIQSNNEKIFRMYCIKAGHTEEQTNALLEEIKQYFKSQKTIKDETGTCQTND